MSDVAPIERPIAADGPAQRRKRPPLWGVVLFLALLGGWGIVNYVASTGGPRIAWIDDDLDAALKRAAERKARVFLYLYEPQDQTHARNEREVFTQRWARDPLKNVVCCRVAVRKTDPLARRYDYNNKPLFLLLDESGQALRGLRTEGAVDEREFFTFIGKPADDYVNHAHG